MGNCYRRGFSLNYCMYVYLSNWHTKFDHISSTQLAMDADGTLTISEVAQSENLSFKL